MRSKKSFSGHRRDDDENSEGETSERPVWATKAVRKRAEEIQQRKLLWSKPKEQSVG